MRKLYVLFFLVFIFLIVNVKAKEKEDIPPGMEIIKIGNVRHLVPKGTKAVKKDGVITLEGSVGYTAQKITNLEESVAELKEKISGFEGNAFESRLDSIDNDIKQLKRDVEHISNRVLMLEQG